MPISIPFSITPNQLKRAVSKVFDVVGVNALCFRLQKTLYGPYVRAVNYHEVLPQYAVTFEQHLEYYSRNFVSVDRDLLDRVLTDDEWQSTRPGLILTFDDGHRTHVDIAAPLLEKYGFTGWFFVPVGLMDLNGEPGAKKIDNPNVLTLEQLRYLAERHIVGSHTQTHCRLGKDLSPERLKSEIIGSRLHLQRVLGRQIDMFCWVGGEEESYGRAAAKLISENYTYSFMTNNAAIRFGTDRFQLQRTNIEAENPLSLLRFQLSGLMDLFYANKRKRVNELTRHEPEGSPP